jgi:hypothetical protein
MTMKIRNLIIGVAAAIFSAGALSQQPIVIKFSHVAAPDQAMYQAAGFPVSR